MPKKIRRSLKKSKRLNIFPSLIVFIVLIFLIAISYSGINLYNRSKAYNNTPIPSGNFGQMLYLDGATGFLTFRNSNMKFTQPYTVEAWIKPEYNYMRSPTIISTMKSYPPLCQGNEFSLALNTQSNTTEYIPRATVTTTTSAYTIGANWRFRFGQWVHLAFTMTSNNLFSLYVNGKLSGSTYVGGTICPNNPGVVIGAQSDGSALYGDTVYKGVMEEVRVYQGLLYDGNFNPLQIPHGANAQTQGLWHFNGSFVDSSFYNNPGVGHGTYTFQPSSLPYIDPRTGLK